MSIFNYKQYSKEQSIELMTITHKLAVYSNTARYMYLPAGDIITFLGKITGEYYPNKFDLGIPEGWRELTPSELKLPDSSKDITGYYTIESPTTGDRLISGMGPQVKLLGEFDAQNNLKRIAISWAGTNDLLDIVDYFDLNEGKIAPAMQYILNAVKNFALSHQLTAEDILVTGYSLGGGLTNVMAKYRETLADGFFANSNYVGHASPLIYDNADVIFNMGFENDAVFRILGDAPTFADAVAEMKPFMVNPDKNFASSPDNIILFTGAYASILWNLSPFSMSILNKPQGWTAHGLGGGVVSDAIQRIGESLFYDFMHKDSRIVLDHLDAIQRVFNWVHDKSYNAHLTPSFIIGSDYNNYLKGNKQGDYIDARGGNDTIRVGEGADRVNGGTGIDKVILDGRSQDWLAYRLKNGDLFMQSKDGTGIKHLTSVEKISFDNESFTKIRPYDVTESNLKSNRYLLKWRNQDVAYKQHTEGSENNDELTGTAVFGQAGDDILHAHQRYNSMLHGGEGNDFLFGKQGNDTLYGAEGNDFIHAGAGTNNVYGGIGNDIFAFTKESKGTTFIRDFNRYTGDQDMLLFSRDLFETAADIAKHARRAVDNVHIYKDRVAIVIQNTTLDDVLASSVVGIV